jgi:hypothetical protein
MSKFFMKITDGQVLHTVRINEEVKRQAKNYVVRSISLSNSGILGSGKLLPK